MVVPLKVHAVRVLVSLPGFDEFVILSKHWFNDFFQVKAFIRPPGF